MSEPDQTIRALGGLALPDRTAAAAAVLVDDMFDVLERLVAAQRRFARATLAPTGAAVADVSVLLPSDPAEAQDDGSDEAAGVAAEVEGARGPDEAEDRSGADGSDESMADESSAEGSADAESEDESDDASSMPDADVDTDGDTLAGTPEGEEENVVADDATIGDDEADDSAEDLDDADDEPEEPEDSDDAPATVVTGAGAEGDEDTGASAPAEAPEAVRNGRPRRPRTEPRTTGTRTRRGEGERPRRSTTEVIRPDDEGNARPAPRRSATTGRPTRRRSAE